LTIELIAAAALGAWVYLFAARGGFWRMGAPAKPIRIRVGQSVCVIIPARNEEALIGQAVASLAGQAAHVIVVDDQSSDRTAAVASEHGAIIVQARPLPEGWSGKLWGISEGLRHAAALAPDYLLFTDADIVHGPNNIAQLVARAETEKLDLVSLMVTLQCRSAAEKFIIPAFVFFFFMLYPPAWVARRDRKTAAAAGGCILIRPSALQNIGGIDAIRGEIIDDCALARAVKRSDGRIWLGLADDTRSIRDYHSFGEIRAMISRTAFAQLRHSALLLLLTILGMAVIYLAPALLLLSGNLFAAFAGLGAWLLMTISYAPVLRFYRRSLLFAPLLPAIALFYMWATVDSAIAYWSGRGGLWKDRIQDLH
jgi:hopene-associated glycosyltransferase HpnB